MMLALEPMLKVVFTVLKFKTVERSEFPDMYVCLKYPQNCVLFACGEFSILKIHTTNSLQELKVGQSYLNSDISYVYL